LALAAGLRPEKGDLEMESAYQCCAPVPSNGCIKTVKLQRDNVSGSVKPEMSLASFLRYATGNDGLDFEHPLLK
jgi:hypothetical protein